MRKFLTLAATVVLAGSMALAQSSGSTAAPSPTPGAQTTVIRGCLKGTGGSYTLSSGGTTYQLSGNTSDLSANVDKTVEITGTNLSDQDQQATQPNQQNFSVQSVNMINDKCESNVGQTPGTQGMTSAVQGSGEAGGTGSSTQPPNTQTLPKSNTTPENNEPNQTTPNTTEPPQNQSSLGTTGNTAAPTSGMNESGSTSQSSAAAAAPSSTQETGTQSSAAAAAPSSTQETGTAANENSAVSQSNPQSMNNPTAAQTNAETANPTGETSAATSSSATSSQTGQEAPSAAATASNAPEGQTGAASTANESAAGTSATENAQGTETAQAHTGKGALPQTASPLPLLGLLGFGSLTGGLYARLRNRK